MIRWLIKKILGTFLVHYRGKHNGMVALTFDDGPTDWTSSILDTLTENQAKATFFMIGERAEKSPEIVERIINTHCELANHTWTHPFISELSMENLCDEVRKTDSYIQNLTGVRPYFRPPYGQLTIGLVRFLIKDRRRAVLWSCILGGDEKNQLISCDQIKEDLHANPIKNGDIILLHDTNPGTAEALPLILEHLNKRSLHPVTLSELIN